MIKKSKAERNPKVGPKKSPKAGPKSAPRKYLSQSDVPTFSLEKALRIPQALNDDFGKHSTKPLMVAQALNMSPSSSFFRKLCGAAIAYGLTEGGCNADEISITPLGNRIVTPTLDGDDLTARREAILKPKVLNDFISRYNGSPLPQEKIALNVLEDMGVPRDRAQDTFKLILESSEDVNIITEIKGKKYINFENSEIVKAEEEQEEEEEQEALSETEASQTLEVLPIEEVIKDTTEESVSRDKQQNLKRKKRVFITHGKKKHFIEPIKQLLDFGEMEPVVSTEKQSVSQPVPDKVINDMRSCGAAIVHVDTDSIGEGEGQENKIVNPNVLIEIGAAMALYGRRFILLVEDGVDLPSNLQGLYQVRYEGENLDSNATIKLLAAIKDIKNHPLPEEK